jgi:LAO/AO transport system kinase
MHPLAEKVIAGDPRALARVCRWVDDAVGDYRTILGELFPHTGRAWTVGVTGAPGAGKSTLCDQLIAALRQRGKTVAVLAIDPSSPFSGGAILGDRIRMQRHHADPGVFIRSVATRGSLGGLSRSAADLVRVLDAWGADVVLVETVGVGQDELEVTRTVDTTLVVMAPGMGDEVQAFKAGLLECADVFAVNKADRDGADVTVRQLELTISIGLEVHHPPPKAALGHLAATARSASPQSSSPAPEAEGHTAWISPIVRTVAPRGEGIEPLLEALEGHRRWFEGTAAGRERRLARLREAMRNELRNTLLDCASAEMAEALELAVQAVARREADPYTATDRLVAAFRGRAGAPGTDPASERSKA